MDQLIADCKRTLVDIIADLKKEIVVTNDDEFQKLCGLEKSAGIEKSTFAEAGSSATSGLQNFDQDGSTPSPAPPRRRKKRRKQVIADLTKFFDERAGKIDRLLKELRDRVEAIADEPLPMGTTSVSPEFLAKRSGLLETLKSSAVPAAVELANEMERKPPGRGGLMGDER